MVDYHIRYEWEMKKQAVDFEIFKVENQLASVEKRLRFLKTDLYAHLAYLLGPLIICGICGFFGNTWTPPFNIPFLIVETVVSMIYVISGPISLYKLVKTICLLLLNRENDRSFAEKYAERCNNGLMTYRQEKESCQKILCTYYIYRQKLDEMGKAMEEDRFCMSKDEMLQCFDEMTYFEAVEVVSPFSSQMEKRAKTVTIMGAIALVGIFIIILF